MLVPGHIVSLYVATWGQNGSGLGSDEKEIVLLIYVIIDVSTSSIVGIKQYLVRPNAHVILQNNQSQQQLQTPQPQQQSPPAITNSNTTTTTTTNSTASSPTPSMNNALPESDVLEEDEYDGPVIGNADLPFNEAVIQQLGRSLKEIIDEFDSYIRSLSIDPTSPSVRLIVDGQLPLRQCLHPEATAKDIKLPSYYWRFCDLRKEFVRSKSGDLSRALIPMTDVKKLPILPALPPSPANITEMVKDLELESYNENDFYIKEARDMVSIIQALLSAGHKFDCIENVNLTLEPGICSIDDEIDGNCIVRARGLPWQSSDQDIAKFFRGLNVAKGGVALCLSAQGRRNGEALIRFISQEHRDMALKRHKHHIGNRYIEVYRASGGDFLAVAGGASNEAQSFLSKGAQVIIRMRGLPYDCTPKQVLDFFAAGENPCQVLDGCDGVLFVKKPDGRATGDAFVLFANESDAPHALAKHRESIGQRYIELFRSTTAEVQQVLNRSLDPKTYEPPGPPLIFQLPTTTQLPLLPQPSFQQVITSGTSKDCIRLRGLPYEAKVEHILHFLEDYAKHIVYQGVHMVYNAQGQPSGEAFIQMDSEGSAYASAKQKHHKYMVYGKKQRYIEVFQCSGDDMNLVLTGGMHHSPANSKPPLLSPGGTYPSFGIPPFGHHPAMLSPHGGPPAYYPQPILYWGYPSPPVSPTTYYGPVPHPAAAHLTAASPQPTMFPVEYIQTPTGTIHHATATFNPRHPMSHHHHYPHGQQSLLTTVNGQGPQLQYHHPQQQPPPPPLLADIPQNGMPQQISAPVAVVQTTPNSVSGDDEAEESEESSTPSNGESNNQLPVEAVSPQLVNAQSIEVIPQPTSIPPVSLVHTLAAIPCPMSPPYFHQNGPVRDKMGGPAVPNQYMELFIV